MNFSRVTDTTRSVLIAYLVSLIPVRNNKYKMFKSGFKIIMIIIITIIIMIIIMH